jgi:hypothetical protein
MAKAGPRKRQSPSCNNKLTTSPTTARAMKMVRTFVSQSGPWKEDQPANPFRIEHTKPKAIVRRLILDLVTEQLSISKNAGVMHGR